MRAGSLAGRAQDSAQDGEEGAATTATTALDRGVSGMEMGEV